MVSSCQVDGEDANEAISRMVRDSRFSEQVRMVMIDGAAFGGFNVVDIQALSEDLGRSGGDHLPGRAGPDGDP